MLAHRCKPYSDSFLGVFFLSGSALSGEKNAAVPVANWLLTGYNTLDVSFHSVFISAPQLRAQHWRTKLRESCLGAIEITVKDGALVLTGGT